MNMDQQELESDVPSLSLELPRKSKVSAVVNDAVETLEIVPTAKNSGKAPAKRRTPISTGKRVKARARLLLGEPVANNFFG